jgi:hypothetical protein
MNFKEQKNAIKKYISDNYGAYLPEGTGGPEITAEFLDFDKYKNDFTLFIDFSRIDLKQSAYKDDCGDIETLSLTVYLVVRNGTSPDLQDAIFDAAWAFYRMVFLSDGRFDTAQRGVLNDITFFNYVEGTKHIVCAELNLSLEIEI